MRPELVAGRVVTAGFLVWMGWIHYHLWDGGYRHILDIGPLFIANSVAAIVVALAVLAVPGRWLTVVAVGAAGLAGGTLIGLAITINHGLFGFRDSLSAPFAEMSIWVESIAAVAALALAWRGWPDRRRNRGRTP